MQIETESELLLKTLHITAWVNLKYKQFFINKLSFEIDYFKMCDQLKIYHLILIFI